MKSVSLFAGVILLSLAACRGTADRVSGSEELEGWRVENGEDVYFMRIPGSASREAAERNDAAMMKATCVQATKVMAADNIIRKMLGETIQGQSGVLDGQSTGVVITSVRSGLIRGTQMKECAPTDENKRYQNCECVHFVAGKDLKKKFELAVEQSTKK